MSEETPVVAAEPEDEKEVKEVPETTETEAKPEGDKPEEKKEEDKEEEQPDPKKEEEARAERKVKNQQRAWERLIEEKARLKAENDLYRRQLEQQQQAKPSGRPARDKFESDEDYVSALTDWTVEQRLGNVKEELAKSQGSNKIQADWVGKITKARNEYPDYDTVLEDASDVPVGPELAEELMSSDLGADVTYYLAKHSDEMQKLNGLDRVSIAKYIGRLEERIERERSSKTKVAVSKAPAPIKPASPSSTPSIKSLEDMSMKEYVAYMDKQEAAKRKR